MDVFGTHGCLRRTADDPAAEHHRAKRRRPAATVAGTPRTLTCASVPEYTLRLGERALRKRKGGMSYSAKAYLITSAATACLIGATVLGIARIWWICGVLTFAAVTFFVLLLRVSSLSTESERRAGVGVAERGIGAAGRALGGGWQPRSKARPPR